MASAKEHNRSEFMRNVFDQKGIVPYGDIKQAWKDGGYPDSLCPSPELYRFVKTGYQKRKASSKKSASPKKASKKPAKAKAARRVAEARAPHNNGSMISTLLDIERTLDTLVYKALELPNSTVADSLRTARREVILTIDASKK